VPMLTYALLIAAAGSGFAPDAGAEYRAYEEGGTSVVELKEGVAWAELPPVRDGVFEADLLMKEGRGFTGLLFRASDAENGELFYFRHHQKGLPDAWQYYPQFNGHQAFQIYQGEGYGGSFATPVGEWTRIRLEVKSDVARVVVDGVEAALLNNLQLDPEAGRFGFWALGGERLIRNVSFRELSEDESARLGAARPDTPPAPSPHGRFIETWQVSLPVSPDTARSLVNADITGLRPMSPVHRGIVDLNKAGPIEGDANSLLVRAEIASPKPQTIDLDLAFSDDADVYLNGEYLFSGTDRFRSRDYRFLGTMGFFDSIPLRLVAGVNRLDVVVSETQGGWGIGGRISKSPDLVILGGGALEPKP
jgi:hypothetical protein